MIKKQHILIIALIFCISLLIITNWSSFDKRKKQVKNITDIPNKLPCAKSAGYWRMWYGAEAKIA